MRRALSAIEPSLFTQTTFSSFSKRLSSFCLRSVSQKKAASARRGRITFSLPEITCAGSFDSMFDTVMKLGSSLPSFITWKYFWCSFIEDTSASGGTRRKSSSNEPANATGHSFSAVTSSRRSSSMMASPPSFLPSAVTCSLIRAERSAKLVITYAPRRVS